ncbi:MAG: recombinase family protein [Gammaproteobacteria bacterium]|nr:recombinase family protein [Gammaproteobacteria bacterium]MCP5197697.1 recombinase family protein [Gammaproteobacteria bacterium]
MKDAAALYLRSSKDRSDVSIDAQARELLALAEAKNLLIVSRFEDVVESAKDENRPGFQALLADLKSSKRQWDHLLMVDTSRLSRRRYMAEVFAHEARKRGVTIIYSKLPDADPITSAVIIGVMQVFDELHSLMSREKGLAGMAENVRQGFRAGGRAPRGYRLVSQATGAIRDGQPVTKTTLEPNEDALLVRQFLEERATGAPRRRLHQKLGLAWPETSSIAMEHNALTYAGHTVWNQHNERIDGRYKGSAKRRPRSEWVIQRDTHPALITDQQAEAILSALESSRHAEGLRQSRRTPATYLLTGLLKTPSGDPWYGDGKGKHYRVYRDGKKSRWVPRAPLEEGIVRHIIGDLTSPVFIRALLKEARKQQDALPVDPTIPLRERIAEITRQVTRAMTLAVQLENSAPALRLVDDLEKERAALAAEIVRQEQIHAQQTTFAVMDEGAIRAFLQGLAETLEQADREAMKDALSALIDVITLDPETRQAEITYHIDVDRNSVASPRGFEPLLSP